jgi:hypothetical protein
MVGSFRIFVHYESGITKLFGEEFLLDVVGGEVDSGSVGEDGNPFFLNFEGAEMEFASNVLNASLTSPLGDIIEDEYNIITG